MVLGCPIVSILSQSCRSVRLSFAFRNLYPQDGYGSAALSAKMQLVGVPVLPDEFSQAKSRFFELGKGDTLIDGGTFETALDNTTLQVEHFSIVRKARRGFMKRKGGGISATAVSQGAGAAFNMDCRWDYDDNLRPLGAATQAHGVFNGKPRDWTAQFVLKASSANLRIRAPDNPMELTVAYKKDWMIDIDPSAVPLEIMLGRYNSNTGGTQEFTWLAYSATAEHFLMGKNILSVKLIDRVDAKNEDGTLTDLDYFICDVTPLERSKKRGNPERRLHLWADDGRRLRKVVTMMDDQKLTITRKQGAHLLEGIAPYPKFLNPGAL